MIRTPRVAFICTGNAGRSQMAAAVCEGLAGDSLHVGSAGVAPWPHLHPMAVKLMTERGISLTGRHPKPVSALFDRVLDFVVTIGDPARQHLPRPFPGDPTIIHWDISDPADADGTPDSEPVFRRTLAMIEARLPELIARMKRQTQRSRVGGRNGVSTGLWYPERFEPARHLPQAVALGCTAIELNCFLGTEHFDFRSAQAVRDLKRVADDLGVEIWSLHEPNNPACVGTVDPAKRQSALDDLKLSLDLAAELGASAIPSHALLHHTYAKAAVAQLPLAVESLLSLMPRIVASGARIAIENGWGQFVAAAEAFSQLPEQGFGMVIDTGHANIAGGAQETRYILEHMGRRMISLHLNDNDGKSDSHHPPGGGTVGWAQVSDGLRAAGYNGCILWEVFARLNGRADDPAEVLRRCVEESRVRFVGQVDAAGVQP